MKILPSICFFLLALSIGIGAFAAHALSSQITPYEKGLIDTACFYLTTSVFGVLLLLHYELQKLAYSLLTGALIFSISLLGIVLSGFKALGAVTPIGGTLMIASYILAGLTLLKRTKINQLT